MLNCDKSDVDQCRFQLLKIKTARVLSPTCHVGSNPTTIEVVVEGVGGKGTQDFEVKMCHIEDLPRSRVEFKKVSPPPTPQEQGYQDQVVWSGTMKTQQPVRM